MPRPMYRPIQKRLEMVKDTQKVVRVFFVHSIADDTQQTVTYEVRGYSVEWFGCYRNAFHRQLSGDGEQQAPLLDFAVWAKDADHYPIEAVIEFLSDDLVC